MTLEVIKYPGTVLFKKTSPVVNFNVALHQLADDMVETMYASHGVGLAAPQVGLLERFLVIDANGPNGLMVMINPEVTWRSPEVMAGEEGCLSLPGVRLSIPRSVAIDAEYNCTDGSRVKRCFTSLEARVVQHEIDHLDGVLLLSRVGTLAKRLALKELGK